MQDDSNDIEIEKEELDDSVVAEENSSEALKNIKDKLKKALEEKQQYLDGWQKDKADFINARKRDKEERENFLKSANEGLISDLLPVLQSFEMAFSNREVWEKVDKNWRVGVEYIYSQLKSTFENYGLKEINPAGQVFDPRRDEAIEFAKVDDRSLDHKIIKVIQKGYELNGRILVAPKVNVGEFQDSK